jgi:hypothetical protein
MRRFFSIRGLGVGLVVCSLLCLLVVYLSGVQGSRLSRIGLGFAVLAAAGIGIAVFSPQPARLAQGYQSAMLLAGNTVVLFVALNFALFVAFAVRDEQRNICTRIDMQALREVEPHLSEVQLCQLLKETWSRPYVFAPFTQFKERPSNGLYVTVIKEGFRTTGRAAPWPPKKDEFTIFVFGGSTTFGYGVPDPESIPAKLEVYLTQRGNVPRVNVYNLGQGAYFSSQERIFFEQLLLDGKVPDLAIFIDGLNDFRQQDGIPHGSAALKQLTEATPGQKVLNLAEQLPMARLARAIRGGTDAEPDEPSNSAELIDRIIDRYFANKKMIRAVAAANNVKTLFVWQPVPEYKYDVQKYHRLRRSDYRFHLLSGVGYARMEERQPQGEDAADWLWLADMQENLHKPLYVDSVHYSGEFAGMIASTIADRIREMNLIASPPPRDDNQDAPDALHESSQ